MTARPPAPDRYTTTPAAYATVTTVLLAVVCTTAGITSGPHAALTTAALLLGIPIAGTAALITICLAADRLTTRRRGLRLRLRYHTAPRPALVLADTPHPHCPDCQGEGGRTTYEADGGPEDGIAVFTPCTCCTPWHRQILPIPRCLAGRRTRGYSSEPPF